MSMMPSEKPLELNQLPGYIKRHPWAPVALWFLVVVTIWLS
jgi:hypothetical protein